MISIYKVLIINFAIIFSLFLLSACNNGNGNSLTNGGSNSNNTTYSSALILGAGPFVTTSGPTGFVWTVSYTGITIDGNVVNCPELENGTSSYNIIKLPASSTCGGTPLTSNYFAFLKIEGTSKDNIPAAWFSTSQNNTPSCSSDNNQIICSTIVEIRFENQISTNSTKYGNITKDMTVVTDSSLPSVIIANLSHTVVNQLNDSIVHHLSDANNSAEDKLLYRQNLSKNVNQINNISDPNLIQTIKLVLANSSNIDPNKLATVSSGVQNFNSSVTSTAVSALVTSVSTNAITNANGNGSSGAGTNTTLSNNGSGSSTNSSSSNGGGSSSVGSSTTNSNGTGLNSGNGSSSANQATLVQQISLTSGASPIVLNQGICTPITVTGKNIANETVTNSKDTITISPTNAGSLKLWLTDSTCQSASLDFSSTRTINLTNGTNTFYVKDNVGSESLSFTITDTSVLPNVTANMNITSHPINLVVSHTLSSPYYSSGNFTMNSSSQYDIFKIQIEDYTGNTITLQNSQITATLKCLSVGNQASSCSNLTNYSVKIYDCTANNCNNSGYPSKYENFPFSLTNLLFFQLKIFDNDTPLSNQFVGYILFTELTNNLTNVLSITTN